MKLKVNNSLNWEQQRLIGKQQLAERVSNTLKETLNKCDEFTNKIQMNNKNWNIATLHLNDLEPELKNKLLDTITRLKSALNFKDIDVLGLREIKKPDGTIYVCHSKRELNHQTQFGDNFVKENWLNIWEYNTDGLYQGRGEIIYIPGSQDDFFKNKPRPGATNTNEIFRNQGLGYKRIINMNIISKALFGLKLHSATLFSSPYAEKVWQKLVSEGLAIAYIQRSKYGEDKTRYKFI